MFPHRLSVPVITLLYHQKAFKIFCEEKEYFQVFSSFTVLCIAPDLSLKVLSCYQLMQAYISTGHLAVPFIRKHNLRQVQRRECELSPPFFYPVSAPSGTNVLPAMYHGHGQVVCSMEELKEAECSPPSLVLAGLNMNIFLQYTYTGCFLTSQAVWRLLLLCLDGVAGDYGTVWEHWLGILCLARVCMHCYMPECSQTAWFVLAGDGHLSCLCYILANLHHCSLLALLRTQHTKKRQ